ncbi:hypothetical protein niasHT_008121 [Heterodera trifolii]|uniref:Small ribosomal subunit protein bS16m n=1 Tax=Heterodera trifolii TaxID=157864 RepID=A0ABD2M040_9BILA
MRQLVNPRTFGRPNVFLTNVGCTNRPVYQITVFPDKALGRNWDGNVLEKLGTFDPLPNDRNEKLVSLNIERIKYWLGLRNANVSMPVLELLGLSGLLPVHPRTFLRARMNRLNGIVGNAQFSNTQQEEEEEADQKEDEENGDGKESINSQGI